MRNKAIKSIIVIFLLFSFLSGTPFAFSQTGDIDAEINDLNLKSKTKKTD